MTGQENSAFYDKWSKLLYNSALRVLKDPMEAEEVMQDSIMRYFDLADKLEKQRKPVLSEPQINVWLHKCCIREAIDRLRKRKTREKLADELASGAEEAQEPDFTVLNDMDPSKDIAIVKQAISELPDKYRIVLSLFLFEGYDYNEIAEVTGDKEVTIRSQYMRGKAKLAEALKGKLEQ
jgi:RNA polymerase sigma factor (sigma-70 family)